MDIFYFILASILIVVVPGPTVSLIIANSLQSGLRAGLLNVVGTQFGVFVLILILALGFNLISPALDQIIKFVRFIGAVYLIFLGIFSFISKINFEIKKVNSFKKKYFLQGLFVILTNPKIFLFLGAFIPQFIDLQYSVSFQIIYLGILFIMIASIFDSAYAFIFSKFRDLLAKKYLNVLSKIGGLMLILVGSWMIIY